MGKLPPFGSADHRNENARMIMSNNIDRHPVGRTLSPEAKVQAVDFAVGVWTGEMGNGTAAEIGIRRATDGSAR